MKKALLALLLVFTGCSTVLSYEATFVVVSEASNEPEGLIGPSPSIVVWLLPSDRFWTDFVAPKLGGRETADQLRKRFSVSGTEGRREGRRLYHEVSVRANSESEFEAFRDAIIAYLTDSHDRELAAALEELRAELARRENPKLAELMRKRISETESQRTSYWLLAAKKPIQPAQPTLGKAPSG